LSRPLNILLITSDQQHWSALGAVNPKIRTPCLDGLAAAGLRFDRAYCPNPTCTPSRASILTGLMPSQHGAWSLGTKLREDLPTLPGLLGEAGFFTALVGKAHFQPLASRPGYESIECQPTLRDLDFWRGFHGPWYGFEHVETARMHTAESHVGGHYAVWMEEQGLTNWRDYFEPWPPDPVKAAELYRSRSWALPEELHYNRWTSDRTVAAMEMAGDRPFFLWSSFHDPHPPYLVPEPWASMYDPAGMEPGSLVPGEHEANAPHFRQATQVDDPMFWHDATRGEPIHGGWFQAHDEDRLRRDMACYYGMTSFMDREIGRILAALEASGRADDTMVIFTSDHGHFLGHHGLTAKAIHMYEDLVRVPFIVRWPGWIAAGGVSDSLQSLVDISPTVLAACGQDIPAAMTGRNEVPNWTEGLPVREDVVIENHHGTECFHMRTFVTATHKITVYRDGDDGELFDLMADPEERRNLWRDAASADVKMQLLHRFLQATLRDESLPMPRIAPA
jgi:arylsulfatase A-like enzyme